LQTLYFFLKMLKPASKDELFGITIKEAEKIIASYSPQEISDKVSQAKKNSQHIELKEDYQLRLTDELLKKPFEIVK